MFEEMEKDDNHNCIDKNELLKSTKINIEKYGLQVIIVPATDYLPSFAYSIGLCEKYQHPEIICFGLPNSLLQEIINDVAEIVKLEGALETNVEYYNIFDNSRALFLKVEKDNINDYFNVALEYYKNQNFSAVQLVWTDRNDKFPWEDNFQEEFIYDQPLLDRNFEFKFREPKNLTTFTTKHWLENLKPIVRVVHDEDGDWQFLTEGEFKTEDIVIVALEQIILRDKTLNEVFDLDYGEEAEREFIGGEWIKNKL